MWLCLRGPVKWASNLLRPVQEIGHWRNPQGGCLRTVLWLIDSRYNKSFWIPTFITHLKVAFCVLNCKVWFYSTVKDLNVSLVVNRRTTICREFQFSFFSFFFFLHKKDNLIGNLLVKCILVIFVLFTILQHSRKCHQTPDMSSNSDV